MSPGTSHMAVERPEIAVKPRSAWNAERRFEILTKISDEHGGGVTRFNRCAELTSAPSSKRFLLKRVQLATCDVETWKKDLMILPQLRHPNILLYVDAWESWGVQHVLCEDACMFLSVCLQQMEPHRPSKTLFPLWLFHLSLALEYMHERHSEEQPMLHRNVHPTNVLINHQCVLKLCAFDVSKWLETPQQKAGWNTVLGGGLFQSPEQQAKKPYNQLADIWCLGMTAIYIADHRQARKAASVGRLLEIVKESGQDSVVVRVIRSTLHTLPAQRPRASAIATLLKDHYSHHHPTWPSSHPNLEDFPSPLVEFSESQSGVQARSSTCAARTDCEIPLRGQLGQVVSYQDHMPKQGVVHPSRPVEDVVSHSRPVQDAVLHSRPVQDVAPVTENLLLQDAVRQSRPVQDVLPRSRPVQDEAVIHGHGSLENQHSDSGMRTGQCLPSEKPAAPASKRRQHRDKDSQQEPASSHADIRKTVSEAKRIACHSNLPTSQQTTPNRQSTNRRKGHVSRRIIIINTTSNNQGRCNIQHLEDVGQSVVGQILKLVEGTHLCKTAPIIASSAACHHTSGAMTMPAEASSSCSSDKDPVLSWSEAGHRDHQDSQDCRQKLEKYREDNTSSTSPENMHPPHPSSPPHYHQQSHNDASIPWRPRHPRSRDRQNRRSQHKAQADVFSREQEDSDDTIDGAALQCIAGVIRNNRTRREEEEAPARRRPSPHRPGASARKGQGGMGQWEGGRGDPLALPQPGQGRHAANRPRGQSAGTEEVSASIRSRHHRHSARCPTSHRAQLQDAETDSTSGLGDSALSDD